MFNRYTSMFVRITTIKILLLTIDKNVILIRDFKLKLKNIYILFDCDVIFFSYYVLDR